jgi:hypothetical protein
VTTVKLKVTQVKFDEHFSIDDWMNFGAITNTEMYSKMILFVVDDEGAEVSPEQARKMFKAIPKREWPDYVSQFMAAVRDAFVSPTNGGS